MTPTQPHLPWLSQMSGVTVWAGAATPARWLRPRMTRTGLARQRSRTDVDVSRHFVFTNELAWEPAL